MGQMLAQAIAASYHNEVYGFAQAARVVPSVNINGFQIRFMKWMFPEGWVSEIMETGNIPATGPTVHVTPKLSLLDGRERQEALLKLLALRNHLLFLPS